LLTELIAVGADVERNRASSLAQRIIDFRDADENPQPAGAEDPAYAAAGSPFRTRGGPLEATEDLLQVLGFDFDLFERLRPLVTVHGRGDGRVDPVAAPLSVLRVLAGGNEQMASAYAAAVSVDVPDRYSSAGLDGPLAMVENPIDGRILLRLVDPTEIAADAAPVLDKRAK